MTSTFVDDAHVVRVRRLKQHLGAFIASLGGFALGVTLGWNSSSGEVFRNNLEASATEIGLVGGILNVGASIGVLLVPLVHKNIGHTMTMLYTLPLFILGWACICLAGQNVSLLIIGRLISGLCGGAFCVLTPTYIAEIADKDVRGRLLIFFHLLINCGVMYAYLMAHVLDEHETVWRYSLVCSVTCLTIGLVNLLPESPLYHLSKNDEDGAKKSLRWYHGAIYEMDEEIDELKRLVLASRSEKNVSRIVSNRRVLRSFLACLSVMLCQQLSGINTMLFYALTLFETGGSGELTGSQQTLVVGAVQILACLISAVLLDFLGRRILLTISSAFMGLFLILLGWFFNLRDADPEYDDTYFWMPPTWITLFFCAFNIGVGPISWSILGDTFPAEIKLTAAAGGAFFSWVISTIATLTFGELIVLLGVPKIMFLFGGFCWIGAILCALLVKETAGKSLLEIHEDFGLENTGVDENVVGET